MGCGITDHLPWLLLRAVTDSLGSPLEELQPESSSLRGLAQAMSAQRVLPS